jgi:hypothetical protein
MNDLDAQEKEFLDQACQLNALDRLMIDNGEKVRSCLEKSLFSDSNKKLILDC